ncbi:hypothetical protein EIP86_005039 [Pleurotus ostreatoroseus]|nr:hypothetical protein EIP86_005039 [Pleurotus ostreatoroseus]
MSETPPAAATNTRKCSVGHCNQDLDENYTFKTCARCRETDRRRKASKRAQKAHQQEAEQRSRASTEPVSSERDASTPARTPTDSQHPNDSSDTPDNEHKDIVTYQNVHDLMIAIKGASKGAPHVDFSGQYHIASDPLVTPRERVQMTAEEVWQVTGYRWTVHDHLKLKTGHKTRFWCSQDSARKKASKAGANPDRKCRDTLGMSRYPCKSRMTVTCKSTGRNESHLLVSVAIKHALVHVPYYDVTLPPEAADIVRECVEWATPNEILRRVQAKYPHVTSEQVHGAWTKMSEVLWKKDPDQLPSAQKLLAEFGDEVDVFDVKPAEGVEQLCWGMKRIAEPLRGQVVEIGLDATYNTNSKHLELYSIMAEHDNAGFPLSYCLLSTATSIDIQKRRKALQAWAEQVRDKYGVFPTFVHLDKDMGEIGMARDVWTAKIQLCWWHLRRAVRTRLAQSKLATSPYNAHRAAAEFHFIDVTFVPSGRPDPTEHEGGIDMDLLQGSDQAAKKHSVNAVYIRIPPSSQVPNNSPVPHTTSNLHSDAPSNDTGVSATEAVPDPERLTIRLPAAAVQAAVASATVDKNSGVTESDNETIAETRTFCPAEHREHIINLMERHLCAHPLIPGYSHPSKEGIREWAVKDMYTFCVKNDLREVWAYLWENWYRPGRWELWARAPLETQIPRLKTTMLLESHWRRIKHDFLHHFRLPRLDLLVWIIVRKLAPTYYRKLNVRLGDTGRYPELADWRKAFKSEWKRCVDVQCKVPFNPKYRPDPYRWVCTCPYFSTSRFLICKHLVRTVKPVDPRFFLEVTRNRTTPFWSHSSLIPIIPDSHSSASGSNPNATAGGAETIPLRASTEKSTAALLQQRASDSRESTVEPESECGRPDDDEGLVDIGASGTTCERFNDAIRLLRELADGLEYQIQFNDHRMLEVVERDAAGALRLAHSIRHKEASYNSTRGPVPRTWDSCGLNVMFYRPRPTRV